MKCQVANCTGTIVGGKCSVCGALAKVEKTGAALQDNPIDAAHGELLNAAAQLKPFDPAVLNAESSDSPALVAKSSEITGQPEMTSARGVDPVAEKMSESIVESPTAPASMDSVSADPVEMLILSSFEQAERERIIQIGEKLKLAPENSYQAWRARADLWVAAVDQLETRQIIADPSIELFGVPLLTTELRRAAENAYRQSAHLSPSFEIRVELIDEANRIRIPTWF